MLLCVGVCDCTEHHLDCLIFVQMEAQRHGTHIGVITHGDLDKKRKKEIKI